MQGQVLISVITAVQVKTGSRNQEKEQDRDDQEKNPESGAGCEVKCMVEQEEPKNFLKNGVLDPEFAG